MRAPRCSPRRTAAFDKSALLYGEDLHNITIEGRGTVDGQASTNGG